MAFKSLIFHCVSTTIDCYVLLIFISRDLIELSGENEIFHLGGDEVNLECWAQHLQKGNTPSNYTDLHDLWGTFTSKALNKLQLANGGEKIPHVIVWSSKLSKRPYITKYLDKVSEFLFKQFSVLLVCPENKFYILYNRI